jgi:hypothetical protein
MATKARRDARMAALNTATRAAPPAIAKKAATTTATTATSTG